MSKDHNQELYDDFFSKKNKKKNKPNVLDQLHEVPKKDTGKNMPKFQVGAAGLVQQADLLSLPEDDGYKYALVVVDDSSRICDAVPLRDKSASTVLAAFKTIYARGILSPPEQKIEVDAGSEFKGVTAKYFTDQDIVVRVAKPERHRQQALVERRNQIIGKALFRRMAAAEIQSGEENKEWVEDLPKLIAAMNKKSKVDFKKQPKAATTPVCEGDSCKMLMIGTKVRVALEAPKNAITGKTLHGKFRTTDLRWDTKVRTIKQILLKPNYPPMYLLDGREGTEDNKFDSTAYTKNQLQVVKKDEVYPDAALRRGKSDEYVIHKILGKKKIKGKWFYRIKWVGYKDPKDETWEPTAKIKGLVPDLVEEFEAKQ